MAKGTETIQVPNDRLGSLVVIRSDAAPSMSLRDYFAGQALTGLLAGSPDADCGPEGYASNAVMMADALLNALGKGGAA